MKQTQHDVQGTQSGHEAPETQDETRIYCTISYTALQKCIHLLMNNPKHTLKIYNSVIKGCKSDVLCLFFCFFSEFAASFSHLSLLHMNISDISAKTYTRLFHSLKKTALKVFRLHQDKNFICKFSEKPDVVGVNSSMRDLKLFAETLPVAVRRHKGNTKLLL